MNAARNGGALAIDVRGLTKRFGAKVAVDHIDIQVPEGEVWGFLGPNGSGKTTTIRMLCGLLTVDEGSGTCLGYDIRRQPELIKRQVGYMTQRFSFWEDLSIRQNLDFVARLYQVPDRKARVTAAIDRLGLLPGHFAAAPAMLNVRLISSETLSAGALGLMLKSARLIVKFARMTSRSPLRSGLFMRTPSLSFR